MDKIFYLVICYFVLFSSSVCAQKQKVFDVNGVQLVMVEVEGGEFQMPIESNTMYLDGTNKHTIETCKVKVDTYMIGQYEVTQELFRAVMGYGVPHEYIALELPDGNSVAFKDAKKLKLGLKYPVQGIPWTECIAFIAQLNILTGAKFRLPTQAEWYYAACGGKLGSSTKLVDPATIDELGWYKDNSDGIVHEVGQKRANALGLYDMLGNVSEWLNDWWNNEGYNTRSILDNPKGPETGSYKFFYSADIETNFFFGTDTPYPLVFTVPPMPKWRPDQSDKRIGFRIVCDM